MGFQFDPKTAKCLPTQKSIATPASVHHLVTGPQKHPNKKLLCGIPEDIIHRQQRDAKLGRRAKWLDNRV
jgi:hypothetical protein